jgi:5-methylcytosine-specific restriction endonuclease McrA
MLDFKRKAMTAQDKKEYDHRRYLADRERILNQKRLWAINNHDKVMANDRRYKAGHREAIRIRDRLRRQTSSETIHASYRKWRSKNLKYCSERQRKWRSSHPGYETEQGRRQRLKYPERYREYNVRRRARERGADISNKETASIIRKWKKLPEFECSYCHLTFPTKRMHIDHIIPISKGGHHTPENICRSCAPCNRRKWGKMPEEFALCE